MMELERSLVAVVPTQMTPAAGFLDQELLHATPASYDIGHATRPATECPVLVDYELGPAVSWAVKQRRRELSRTRREHSRARVTPRLVFRPQVVLSQPVTHAPIATSEPFCQLPNAQAGVDCDLKLKPLHTNVCSRMGRTEPCG